MNLFNRIKNIWNLGEVKPMEVGEQLDIGDTHIALKKDVGYRYEGKPQAKIISRKLTLDEEVEQLLKEDKNNG